MTITPEKAYEEYRKNNKGKIENLERKIDKILTDNVLLCNNGSGIYISANYLEGLFEIVREKYENAGWTIKYQSDQRDGDYYVFTPKRKGNYRDVLYGGER